MGGSCCRDNPFEFLAPLVDRAPQPGDELDQFTLCSMCRDLQAMQIGNCVEVVLQSLQMFNVSKQSVGNLPETDFVTI